VDKFHPDLLRDSCQASFTRETHCPCAAYGANAGRPAARRRPAVEAGLPSWSTSRPVGNCRLRATLPHDHAHPSIVITRIGHHDQALEAPSG